VTVALETEIAEIAVGPTSWTLTAAKETEIGIRNRPGTKALEIDVVCGISRPPGITISVLTLTLEAEVKLRRGRNRFSTVTLTRELEVATGVGFAVNEP
jgi:hypothetical protein